MVLNISGNVKKRITLIMIVLLTVVFCESIDPSYDSLESSGVLKGNTSVSVAHSLEAFLGSTAGEEGGRNCGDRQNIEKGYAASDLFCRIIRKTPVILDCSRITVSSAYLKHFGLSIYLSGGCYLFLLILVRFIHLKDGCK